MSRKCATSGCKNKRAPRRNFCHTCFSRKKRLKNPLVYAYNNLKTNAKRRGIYFAVTLDHFKQFCESTNYLNLRGKGPESMTIDRDKPELGYTDGNLKMLSKSDNSKKRFEDEKRLRYAKVEEATNKLLAEIEADKAELQITDEPPF